MSSKIQGPFVAITSANEAIGGMTLFALDRDGRIWKRPTGYSDAWQEIYEPPHNTYWPKPKKKRAAKRSADTPASGT